MKSLEKHMCKFKSTHSPFTSLASLRDLKEKQILESFERAGMLSLMVIFIDYKRQLGSYKNVADVANLTL